MKKWKEEKKSPASHVVIQKFGSSPFRPTEVQTFTSRFAPGIQICSGRGSAAALQSIAFSTMARIRANHQLARAMRPSRPAGRAAGGR